MKSEIISFLIKNRINKINWSLNNPIDSQIQILNYLIKKEIYKIWFRSQV